MSPSTAVEAARRLKASGAEGLLLASNTMHQVADEVAEETGLPILHIGDAAAERIVADGRTRVALLGTRFAMTEPFLRERYESRGIQLVDLEPAVAGRGRPDHLSRSWPPAAWSATASAS